MQKQKLYVKLEKSHLGQREVKYLGHLICSVEVAVNLEKMDAMLNWPKPVTLKALRGFLRLIGYYRKFIQNYGKVVRPLTAMLKKDLFTWDKAAETTFFKLKESMPQALVLALPNFLRDFIVEGDACRINAGEANCFFSAMHSKGNIFCSQHTRRKF